MSKNNRNKIRGTAVVVVNDNYEKALRNFKKKILESGKLIELKEREFFEKPSITKRKEKNQQIRRAKKKREAESLPKRLY
jgi:small subunit ribosomal protein S21